MKNNVSFNSELSKFGIGLFETIKVKEYPIDLDLHLDRLFNSVNELNLTINNDKKFFKEEILKYIKYNKVKNKALRLTIFDEGYNISLRDIPYSEETYKNGFKIMLSPIKRGESIIYKHKTTNYYENIYTKKYANKNGFDDGLFLDTFNNVLECSMSNILFIQNDVVYTPSSKLPLLDGIVKKRIMDICSELNIQLIEKNINIEDIRNFDFAFVTNSLMNAVKVTQIEDIYFEPSNEVFEKIIACI